MRQQFVNYREMKRRLEDFYLANKDKFEAIAILKEIFDALFVEFETFEKAWEFIEKDHSGSTVSKKQIKQKVASQLAKCQLLLYNYCIKENLTDDLPNFKASENILNVMADEKLLTQIEFTIAYLEEMGESISDTGITDEDVSSLKNDYLSYESVAPQPRLLRGKNKLASEKLASSRLGGMFIINERLDKVMQSLFEVSEPDFFKDYLEAATLEKINHTKLALMGKVLDKTSQQPVPEACICIDSIGLRHEIRGKKGGFRIARLEAGSYKLRIEAPTYKTVVVDIIQRQGVTNVVNVEMESEEAVNN